MNRMSLTSKTRIYSIKNPVIAITGGIATGKSFICDLLKERNLPVISADEQIKLIYKEEAILKLLENDAPQVLNSSAEIDFKQLRALYFNDSSKAIKKLRSKLNTYIYSRLETKVREFSHTHPEEAIIFYEVPLLFEKNLSQMVDSHILVYAPRGIQISRIQSRDQSSIETIQKILESQISIEEKRKLSKYIIDNSVPLTKDVINGIKEQLEDILELIHEQIAL